MSAGDSTEARLAVTFTQRVEGSVPEPGRIIEACEAAIRAVESAPEGNLAANVVYVDDAEIARLSGEFRACAHVTDVLSFPGGETDPETGRTDLGEIILSRDTARREAEARGVSTEDELLLYVVHGMLHLLGMEDESDAGRSEMVRLQLDVLEQLGMDVAPLRVGFDE